MQFFLHHHDLQSCSLSYQKCPEYQHLCSDINKTHFGFAHRQCCKVLQQVRKLLSEEVRFQLPRYGSHLNNWEVENKPKGWHRMAQRWTSASYDFNIHFYAQVPIRAGASAHLQTYLIKWKQWSDFFFHQRYGKWINCDYTRSAFLLAKPLCLTVASVPFAAKCG